MFLLRVILFLFVAGSINVIALLLANTLPALNGSHLEAVAVVAGFLLVADAIFLYLLFFHLPNFKKSKRYQEFEDILDDRKTGDEADADEFKDAYREWKDEY